ncbi:MAG: STAS domain-containing protein [Holophaga sp.]|nr:STAS domain-containing protein [Holophaga sp.]
MAAAKSPMKTQKTDGTVRLNPKGDLVASTVETLRDGMVKALESATEAVVLDLSSTKQIDSLGITLVLGLFKSCQKKEITFSIEGANTDLLRVFKLFNLTKFFSITEATRE